ncbi:MULTISPECIES: beta-glucosidase BglX [unclassified Robiginitalea]|uniref:beta-glucosidase BglX n=1 Tax=Robiginitalea TaxID=252306 RepID=UPI002348FED7|nr:MULTISPECIES: beta-glucosidase BglX [unclassified Robiginitalea]MDC6355372.1 beta-glucosidase BglX [Robiginitalea sp. PM2]MDC6375413.1 beta-glucosidase BglX [Robiginitalea sp. SP8]
MRALSFLLLFTLCTANVSYSQQPAGQSADAATARDAFIRDLLSRMTLEEKVGQMNQYNGFWDVTGPVPEGGDAERKYEDLRSGRVGSMLNITNTSDTRKLQEVAVKETRLGIPLIFGQDVIHGFKTISPIPLAEAASWDLEAIRKSAELAAREAAASGIHWTFAPMVDISRDPRWGRVMEGAGEDPYLGSRVGVARVRGFQGDDLSDPLTIAACLKHFAGYGFAEGGRDYNTADFGLSTLYNVVLPPFQAGVDAGAATVMNSFNVLNGIPATADAFLQRDILKAAWDFQGFVVSDWGSIGEMIPHGYARDRNEAALRAAVAGSDMDMESGMYLTELPELVRDGKVPESLVDEAVLRILGLKYDLGLFADPYRYADAEREKRILSDPARLETVRDMARKSIVLLKNEGDVLPLSKNGGSIALIGPLASDKDSPLGSWRLTAEPNSAVSVLEGMQAYSGNTLAYERGVPLAEGETAFVFETKINTTDRSGIPAAVELARSSETVVMVLGEHGFQSGEGRSRAALGLPGLQKELLEAVHAVNPNIVLVLMNGRPLTINWAAEHVPAILEAWHLGTESGHAIAEVLYGDYNPSGKLPMTFPKSVGQIPVYYSHLATGRPEYPGNDLVFWSHYIDQVNEPLYPFGHGLSYSDFRYADLKLQTTEIRPGGSLEVSVRLENASDTPGTEIVQLYVRDHFGSRSRPVRELKGFEKVFLEAGGSAEVSFTLSAEDLAYYTAGGTWEAEPGRFSVYVGGSSRASLQADFTLTE